MSTGTLGLYLFFTSSQPPVFWAVALLLTAMTGFVIDAARARSAPLNKFILSVAGPLMRRSEREGYTGLPFYALGCSVALFLFHRDIAILAIMFLVFSDPVSSIFGVLYGKDKILPNKSLQGAVAGFFTCYLLTLFYIMNTTTLGTHILVFAMIAGVIGTLSELVSAFNIDDNLSIPVLSGLGLTLLNHFVHVIG